MKLKLFLIALLATLNCNAQQLVEAMNQSFLVHSPGNLFVNSNSNSRNVIEVTLPEKTTGYVYRVTSSKRNSQGNSLLELLKRSATPRLKMEISLAQYVINQTDGQSVDIFAFDNPDDANSFLRKQNDWQACWQNMGVISTCFTTAKCINPVVYFGFRNNNLTTPVNVHVEVVALVDTNP